MMTKNAQKVDDLINNHGGDLLEVLLDDPDMLFMLKNIAIKGQLYHGISPRLCKNQNIITMDNLEKMQKYCLLLSLESEDEPYFDIADKVAYLLNENVPVEEIYTLTLPQLQKEVERRLEVTHISS